MAFDVVAETEHHGQQLDPQRAQPEQPGHGARPRRPTPPTRTMDAGPHRTASGPSTGRRGPTSRPVRYTDVARQPGAQRRGGLGDPQRLRRLAPPVAHPPRRLPDPRPRDRPQRRPGGTRAHELRPQGRRLRRRERAGPADRAVRPARRPVHDPLPQPGPRGPRHDGPVLGGRCGRLRPGVHGPLPGPCRPRRSERHDDHDTRPARTDQASGGGPPCHGPSRAATAALRSRSPRCSRARSTWRVAPEHLEHWWVFGTFFVVTGLFQLAYATAVLRRPTWPVALTGIVVNLGIVLIWVLSRTAGLPITPPEDGGGHEGGQCHGDVSVEAGERVQPRRSGRRTWSPPAPSCSSSACSSPSCPGGCGGHRATCCSSSAWCCGCAAQRRIGLMPAPTGTHEHSSRVSRVAPCAPSSRAWSWCWSCSSSPRWSRCGSPR